MKKLLALVLALLMVLSIALVSCGEKPEATEEPTDDFFNVGGDETEEGDEPEETDDKGNTTTAAGYTEVNDTVYLLYNTIIRKKDKISSEEVARAEFGAALARTKEGSKWSVVTCNGVTGYVPNEFITTNANAVTFTEVEAETKATLKNLGDAKTLRMRKTSLALTATEAKVVDFDDFSSKSTLGVIQKDTEVTIIAISGDKKWAKVTCEITTLGADGKYSGPVKVETGYVKTEFLDYNTGDSNIGGADDYM